MLTLPRMIQAREARSEHDMLMLLNFELSAYDECSDCRFTGVRRVIRDESGSNWRGAHLESGGAITENERNVARHVIHEVRQEYNLE